MKKLFLLLCILAWAVSADAQNDPLKINVIPPSPNAASLGKYGDIPVGLYTGIPNINIPLYEVRSGDLSLPISLSYHAGGIKVEEIASWVGLGWSLNAGGVITRQVRGRPDELPNGYFGAPLRYDDILNMNVNDQYTQLKLAAEGEIDLETDMYHFNFSGYSGKFFFDEDNIIHTMPQSPIKIENNGSSWEITAENGITYSFGQIESVVATTSCNNGILSPSSPYSAPTTWYLTKIKSVNGDWEVNFAYEMAIYNVKNLSTSTKYLIISSLDGYQLPNEDCFSLNDYQVPRLKEISMPNGKILFNANVNRCDLIGDKALSSIEVYDQNNQILKKYTFDYDYFLSDLLSNESSLDLNICDNNPEKAKYRRLKLLALHTWSNDVINPTTISHKFKYNEDIKLPHRYSFAQDHWGYFNNQLSNNTLVPTFTRPTFYGLQEVQGANRSVSSIHTPAFTIKEIEYPTGGKTIFEFENNTILGRLVGEEETIGGIAFISADNQGNITNNDVPFSINHPNGGVFAKVNVNIGCSIDPSNIACGIIRIKRIDVTPNVIYEITGNISSLFLYNGSYKIIGDFSGNTDIESLKNLYVAVTWTYPAQGTGINPNAVVGGLRIKNIISIPNYSNPSIIKNYKYHLENEINTSSGAIVSLPIYEYEVKFCGSGGISDALFLARKSLSNIPLGTTQGSYVGYSNVVVEMSNGKENGYSQYTYTNPASHSDAINNSFPFPPTQSQEWRRGLLLYQKDYAKIGSMIHKVREVENQYTLDNISPLKQKETTGLKVGINSIGCSIANIQFTTYKTKTEFIYLQKSTERLYSQDNPNQFIETVTNYAYNNPKHLQPTETRTTNSVGEELITRMKYPLDYNFNNNAPVGDIATGIANLQSKNIISPVIEKYVTRRNTTTNVERVLSGVVTTYRTDKPLPDAIYLMKGDNTTNAVPPTLNTTFANTQSNFMPSQLTINNAFMMDDNYEARARFHAYDTQGNLLEHSKTDDVRTAFIWGYNGTLPIAEVVNARSGMVYHNSFEEDGTTETSTQLAKTGRKYKIGGFTIPASFTPPTLTPSNGVTPFNGEYGTRYILSYWYKNNASDATWIFVEETYTGQAISRNIIDEVRIFPENAMMTTMTYDPLVGKTSVTDPNNVTTYFVYDGLQRLLYLKDQDGNLIQKTEYNYKKQN